MNYSFIYIESQNIFCFIMICCCSINCIFNCIYVLPSEVPTNWDHKKVHNPYGLWLKVCPSENYKKVNLFAFRTSIYNFIVAYKFLEVYLLASAIVSLTKNIYPCQWWSIRHILMRLCGIHTCLPIGVQVKMFIRFQYILY